MKTKNKILIAKYISKFITFFVSKDQIVSRDKIKWSLNLEEGIDLSIYLFGGEILKGFSLAMILGVIFGTYSSIYIANPILVLLKVSQRTIIKEEKD